MQKPEIIINIEENTETKTAAKKVHIQIVDCTAVEVLQVGIKLIEQAGKMCNEKEKPLENLINNMANKKSMAEYIGAVDGYDKKNKEA
jgi:phosphopantothenate synthetase